MSRDTQGLEGGFPCRPPLRIRQPASPWEAGATPLLLPCTLTLSRLFLFQAHHLSYRACRLERTWGFLARASLHFPKDVSLPGC